MVTTNINVNDLVRQMMRYEERGNLSESERLSSFFIQSNCYIALSLLVLAQSHRRRGKYTESWNLLLQINSVEKILELRRSKKYKVGSPNLEDPSSISLQAKRIATRVASALNRSATAGSDENYPTSMNIEMTNACNAKCFMCPATTTKRPRGRMPDEVFQKIFREISTWPVIPYVGFHGVGEPLIDKRLLDRMAALKAIGVPMTLVTNGSLLNQEVAQRLLQIKVDCVNVSLETLDAVRFEEIRIGLNFDAVRNNLVDFLRLRNEANAWTKVGITVILSERNPEKKFDIAPFVALGLRPGDWIQAAPMHNFGSFFKFEDAYYKPGQMPCSQLFGPMNIGYDGNVMLCCVDSEYAEPMGSVLDRTVFEIFNGEKFRQIRRAHLEGRRSDIAVCRTCDYPESMSGQNMGSGPQQRMIAIPPA